MPRQVERHGGLIHSGPDRAFMNVWRKIPHAHGHLCFEVNSPHSVTAGFYIDAGQTQPGIQLTTSTLPTFTNNHINGGAMPD
ncbi:hypothetical protein T10_1858 [Trichinella papuae]|uniref:Uncharacterized protein n=1 Tax=Trichinella papuae TaxID=268474 RepID=A0A0V1M6W3_9BILA|nr:hypothetical protein T10_1858 [Trichinella papuae]